MPAQDGDHLLASYLFPTTIFLLIATTLYFVSVLCTSRNIPYSRFKRIEKTSWFSWPPGVFASTWIIDQYVQKGYDEIHKVSGLPFVMRWWAHDYLFMPPKYLQDIKRAEANELSFFQTLSDSFSLSSSIGDLYSTNVMLDVVAKGLNPQLPSIVPLLAEERDYAFDKEIGEVEDWKTFNATEVCGRIMHRVTSRILVGPELCRDDKFISVTMDTGKGIFMNAVLMVFLSVFPFSLGPLEGMGSWIGTPLFSHSRELRRATNLIFPVVQKRLRDKEVERGPGKHVHVDAIEWTIQAANSIPNEMDPHRLTHHVIHNLWAGSSAPGALVTQLLFQVIAHAEYIEPLRNETENLVSKYGWVEKTLNGMVLLDSFIRETNRLYPAGCAMGVRTVMRKPFTFHDGLTIPIGTRIAYPTLAIMRDPDTFGPLKFDGFRFAELEGTNERNESAKGASTVSMTNLAFGYGRHACPGRYYAIRKAKLIFGKMLLEYDFKWGDAKRGGLRPPSFSIEGQFAPNLTEKIMVRCRRE